MLRSFSKRVPGAVPTYRNLRNIRNAVASKRAISDYLATHATRKLHIGCGENVLPDWLNSDFRPYRNDVVHLDATKPFPLPDKSFESVYSEHMIEHVTYANGLKMLVECHRILQPGGFIRISTPDLQFLVELYASTKSKLQEDYIRWTAIRFLENIEPTDTVVINNFVRAWGHQFIYDRKTLARSLEQVGFDDVRVCALNESEHPELRGLENEARMPPGFLRLESLILEARRP